LRRGRRCDQRDGEEGGGEDEGPLASRWRAHRGQGVGEELKRNGGRRMVRLR
jgi:hypothetical protein